MLEPFLGVNLDNMRASKNSTKLAMVRRVLKREVEGPEAEVDRKTKRYRLPKGED